MGDAEKNLKEYAKIEEEINRFIENYKDSAEEYPDKNLLIVYVKSPYYINSIVSTRISLKMPSKVVLCVQEDKFGSDRIAVSARCQNWAIHLGNLMRDAIKGFKEASAGGHIPAAGANLRKKDFEEFKNNVLDLVKKPQYRNGN